MTCQVCGANTHEVIDFGKMPIANGFIEPEEKLEYVYNLRLVQCKFCEMVQLDEQPAPEMMFNESYPFFTGSSEYMKDHFWQLSSRINPNSFVVEIGSNDGTFLDNFPNHLGIEPSNSAHEKALAKRIRSINRFFSEHMAEEIVDQHGKADVIYAANCLCHIKDINEVLRGVRWLLKDDGVFIFEDPYLGAIVHKAAYDQIYDEHFFYFSVDSVDRMLNMHGLTLFSFEPLEVHGGSMRYTCGLATNSREQISDRIDLSGFADRVNERADQFTEKVKSLNGNCVGYAATSKSTTVLNYCKLSVKDIPYIVDSTYEKQGLLTPGTHIPILPVHSLEKAENVILFAPNHEQEIRAKHPEFEGQWLTY